MKIHIVGWLAVLALAAVATAAPAAPITWSLHGSFSFLDGTDAPSFPIQPTVPFSLVLHFDDAATLTNPGCGGVGTVCRYDDPTMFWSDFTSGPIVNATFHFDTGTIAVFNDAPTGIGGIVDPMDGYLFIGRLTDAEGNLNKFSVFFVTPGDIVSGPGIPSSPPAIDADMVARTRYCRGPDGSEGCEAVFLSGPTRSASVPEPGSMALLGVALALLGVTRRRNRA